MKPLTWASEGLAINKKKLQFVKTLIYKMTINANHYPADSTHFSLFLLCLHAIYFAIMFYKTFKNFKNILSMSVFNLNNY